MLADGFVVFGPHTMFAGRLEEALEWFCTFAFDASSRMPGAKLLLLHEAWKYCTPGSIPMPLATCIQTGRKRGLGMAFATQRPNRLNESITNETTELVCFRLQGENALTGSMQTERNSNTDGHGWNRGFWRSKNVHQTMGLASRTHLRLGSTPSV